MHNRVKELLNKISLDENVKELFKIVLRDVIQSNTLDVKARIEELKMERKSLEVMLENTEDKYLVDGLSPEEYVKIKTRYSDKINDIENRIDSLKENDVNLIKYVNELVDLPLVRKCIQPPAK